MGKASRIKRERAQQPQQKPGYCEHCLDTLHSIENSAVADAMVEAYREMRSQFQYSHVGAMAWLEQEVGAMLQALKSSGEQYNRDCEIEFGEGAHSQEELDAWVAREEARRTRHREASGE